MMKTKVLLDTDIGSDIDDAVCLAYLLAQPRCDLLGVTTVTGEAEKRAMMVSAMCRAAGRGEIPIYPGCDSPILVKQRQPIAQQAPGLAGMDYATSFPRGEAVEFLRRTIRANPGEVVLLTIGPLTNAGLLFAVDPEIPSLLKGLVMMAGHFKTAECPTEWNTGGDPHATAIVYRARAALHRSIGLDVTMGVRLEAPEVRERLRGSAFAEVMKFYPYWVDGNGPIIFHDPLAAATIFDESLCEWERGSVEVPLTKEEEGWTRWTASGEAGAPHEIASSVDAARYFEHFFSVFE